MKAVVAAVSAFVLLLLPAPAVSQVPDDKLIVPGERVGKFTLTMAVAEILGALGPVTKMPPSRFGDQALQNDLTLYIWDVVPLLVVTRDEKASLCIGIRRSRDYQTSRGITYEIKPDAVRDAYGTPTREVLWGNRREQLVLIYDSLGIAFFLVDEGIVGSILVFRPQTANSIWKP